MSYNFEYLRKKEQKKEPIGKWRGKEVHPISFNNYTHDWMMGYLNNNYYYCVYDDNNYLINMNNIEARLFEDGNIDTVAPRVYWSPSAPKKSKPAAVEVSVAADTTASGTVELNVASIIADVDKLLASACSWTVGAEV